MVPGRVPKVILEASRPQFTQEDTKASETFRISDAIRMILGAIWTQAGRHLGLKINVLGPCTLIP